MSYALFVRSKFSGATILSPVGWVLVEAMAVVMAVVMRWMSSSSQVSGPSIGPGVGEPMNGSTNPITWLEGPGVTGGGKCADEGGPVWCEAKSPGLSCDSGSMVV